MMSPYRPHEKRLHVDELGSNTVSRLAKRDRGTKFELWSGVAAYP